MPIFETYTRHALDTARCIHNGEQKICDKAAEFDEGKPEFSFAEGLDTKELETKEGKL